MKGTAVLTSISKRVSTKKSTKVTLRPAIIMIWCVYKQQRLLYLTLLEQKDPSKRDRERKSVYNETVLHSWYQIRQISTAFGTEAVSRFQTFALAIMTPLLLPGPLFGKVLVEDIHSITSKNLACTCFDPNFCLEACPLILWWCLAGLLALVVGLCKPQQCCIVAALC